MASGLKSVHILTYLFVKKAANSVFFNKNALLKQSWDIGLPEETYWAFYQHFDGKNLNFFAKYFSYKTP